MALSTTEAAVIEAWSGPIQDPVDAENRLVRLGRAEVVALELLSREYARRVTSPSAVGASGDAEVRWGDAQLKALAGRVQALAEYASRIVGLNAEASQLIAAFLPPVEEAATAPMLAVLAYDVDNSRPG